MSQPTTVPAWQLDLLERGKRGIVQDPALGLRDVEAVDRALQRPCEGIATVHVVGTNGKGSTSAMAAHALQALGRKVGLYTSPHLHRLHERIRVNGTCIDDHQFVQALAVVHAAELQAGVALSFFEALTLVALVHFAQQGVDAIVLEAGLGGRLDATRVRTSSVVLFAAIDRDHEAYLGHTLAAIAGEKAAVMHPRAPAFTVRQPPEVLDVLQRSAQIQATTLQVIRPLDRPPQPFTANYQADNGGLALAGVRTVMGDFTIVADALDGVKWPGRLEKVSVGAGHVLFDVAHNLHGIAGLVEHLQAGHENLAAVVFGTMADKDVAGMWNTLLKLAVPLWWAPPGREGAATDLGLLATTPAKCFDHAASPHVLAEVQQAVGQGQTIAVCGSHFTVAPIRAGILQLPKDPSGTLSDPVRRQR